MKQTYWGISEHIKWPPVLPAQPLKLKNNKEEKGLSKDYNCNFYTNLLIKSVHSFINNLREKSTSSSYTYCYRFILVKIIIIDFQSSFFGHGPDES